MSTQVRYAHLPHALLEPLLTSHMLSSSLFLGSGSQCVRACLKACPRKIGRRMPARFRVSGFGFRVSGLGFRVSGFGYMPTRMRCTHECSFGFRVSGLAFRVSGLRYRVSGFRFGVWGLGFRVSGLGLEYIHESRTLRNEGSQVLRARGLGFRVCMQSPSHTCLGFRI
jgi:hypothetical protein